MEIKWLYDFVSLANTGNFSRSAEDRNVTQSAFSRRIQSLEQWLGTELVNRKTHPVSLTDAGIRFLKPARVMIRQSERVRDEFSSQRKSSRGSLTFTSSTNLATAFLPQWIMGLKQSFGDFDLKVQTDVSGIHDHFEALRTRQSDFLLHYGHGVGMLAMDAAKFSFKVVGQDVLILVCRDSFEIDSDPMSGRTPICYVSPWQTSSIAYMIAEKITTDHPAVRLRTIIESSTVGCTKAFVELGAGAAWLPASAVQEDLDSGRLVRVADESFDIPLSIQLYRYVANRSSLAARFWEQVEEVSLTL